MDKNTMMQDLARELNKKDSFNGAWLYAENGGIVSKCYRLPESRKHASDQGGYDLSAGFGQ